MNVAPPKSWGKLAGTVNGVSCDTVTAPLSGAVIQVNGADDAWTLFTEADGTYARWMAAERNLQMIAAKDGYVPQVRTADVKRGQTSVQNFNLKRSGC